MRRQLPNDQRPFRLFRDTELEHAREQARLRLGRQDSETVEDTKFDNKPFPVDNTDKATDKPVSNEPTPTVGFVQEPNGFSQPDWPFTDEEPEAEQIKLQTPSRMIFGELATAYVPWQTFSQTLDLREALRVGTLFPELIRTPPLYKKPGA